MNLGNRKGSKLSLSYVPEESAPIYRTVSVSLYSTTTETFTLGKVVVREDVLYWSCPLNKASGLVDLRQVSLEMMEGMGLLLGTDAYAALSEHFSVELNTDLLIAFRLRTGELFILFGDWSTMEQWVEDLLAVLNDIDSSSLENTPRWDSQSPSVWIFDMNYRRLTEENVEIKVTFVYESQKLHVTSSECCLSHLNVELQTKEILAKNKQTVGTVDRCLIENFLLNCLREKLAVTLSKDIITPYSKDQSFHYITDNAEVIEDWYRRIEIPHKKNLLSLQLSQLATDKVGDPLVQIFRLLELQKLSTQIDLQQVCTMKQVPAKSNPKILFVDKDLIEHSFEQELLKNSQVPAKDNEFSCNCSVI